MLTITNIKKEYRTGALVQQALGGVSLSLRDSEFVAILGQSGSGKTTLLNIIGGLDRYDDGDIVINGVSTKRYTDRDWDSYRNHTVGFVFQSYNLIPHQTILKNVELALTISGVSAKERSRRAEEALRQVGLEDHIHKNPSQLSGGQMQRVAIARALVNDPDILLADEPTGALDSETSLQVMELLKEVARDRLVVMVTHNPELADAYATRIVTLKDGKITSDSDPFEPERTESVHKNLGRASMSFLTALSLSFNNLWTKKARTILVSFAGSIGIIGIAMILSMSTGANMYIRSVEEESLQSYPLTITNTSFNLMSMYTEAAGEADASKANAEANARESKVDEWRMLTGLFSGVSANDLESLRAYFESDECDIYDYVQALEYSYSLTPQIFQVSGDSYRQVNPGRTLSALGFTGDTESMSSLMSGFSSTNTFFALPRDKELYRSTYDLKAGSWPEKYDECVVVLSTSGRITDITLYTLGLKDPAKLDEMLDAFTAGNPSTVDEKAESFYYSDIIGVEFSLLPSSSYYTYDKEYKVWSDRSSDKKYIGKLLKNAEKLHVVGIVQPSESGDSTSIEIGIGYSAELTDHLMEAAADSDIVKAQMAEPDKDVFSGKPFGEADERDEISLSSLFSVDRDAIADAFDFDTDSLSLDSLDLSSIDFSDLDLSSAISSDELSDSFPSLTEEDIEELLSGIEFNINSDDLQELFSDLFTGYIAYAKTDPKFDTDAIPGAIAGYLSSQDARDIMISELQSLISSKAPYAITSDDMLSAARNVIDGYQDYLNANGVTDSVSYEHFQEYLGSQTARDRANASVTDLTQKLKDSLISSDEATAIATALATGYEDYANKNGLPSAASLLSSFGDYLSTDDAKSRMTEVLSGAIDSSALEKTIESFTGMMSSAVEEMLSQVLTIMTDKISDSMSEGLGTLLSGVSGDLMSAFNFDTDALTKMFKTEMSTEELQSLITSLLSDTSASYESNLKKMGYANTDKPSAITIYPSDFDGKNHIKSIISDYNARVKAAGEDEKVIKYTDMVDALMGSVTVIIDVISYVLIAFVAISLVVSSIMIGVITYISVLERRKEIGILRAIGASKRNISQVFNAETFIIGSLAGVIGIVITELAIIPANLILHSLSGIENINAVLPPLSALILILLSIALTLLGGLIPSRKAAKSDPVAALRSE